MLFPEFTDTEIDYIIMQQFQELDRLEALDQHWSTVAESLEFDEHGNIITDKKVRVTNCWGCDKLDLNSSIDEICPECGWIICPDCNKCKPECQK